MSPPQSSEGDEQKDSATIDLSLAADDKENEVDLTPVERAIIAKQLQEDKLAHTPEEGDPIRGDILQSSMEFMENSNEVVQSCFGTNIGILNS